MLVLSWIVKNYKIVLLGIIVSIVISLWLGLQHYKNKYFEEKSAKELVIALNDDQANIIKQYKTKEGANVLRIKALAADTKAVKQLVEQGQLDWLKSMEGLKKNLKNLEFAYNIQAKASDSLLVKLEEFNDFKVNEAGDTVVFQGLKFNYQDKYTSIAANRVSLDSVKVTYTIDVPVAGSLYWTRKWFLGKKTYEAEITSENPHVTIPKAISFKATRKRGKRN